MTGALVVIALAAVLAAVAFFLAARSARASIGAKEAALRALQAEKDALEKEAGSARAECKERRDEVNALRDQLRDSKKRAFEQQEAQKKAGGIAAVRAEADKLGTKLAEARAEGAAAAERAKSLEVQLDKVGKDLERERAASAQALSQARAEVERAAAPKAEAAPPPAATDESRLRAERDRADKAEAKLAESKKKLLDAEKDLKAARGRLETDRRVYMVQKGELDLAHDRIAELRRRYDSLRKEHEELIDAVRQAAREEQRRTEAPDAPAEPTAQARVTPASE